MTARETPKHVTPAQQVRRCFAKAISLWSAADGEYIIKADLGGKVIGFGKSLQAAWDDAARKL